MNRPITHELDVDVLTPRVRVGELFAYPGFARPRWWETPVGATLGPLVAVGISLACGWVLPRIVPEAPSWLVVLPILWVLGAIALWIGWLIPYVRRVRLARFAFLNGCAYADHVEGAPRAGAAFSRAVRNLEQPLLVVDDRNLQAEIGWVRPLPDRRGGRAEVRRPFVFAELRLPSSVPHLVLTNRRARVLPTQGLTLRTHTTLSVEGDFNRTFTLRCPAGYERDALYVFTPDVLAALLDVASDAEVELVDDRLYLYLSHRTPLWRAAQMGALLEALVVLSGRVSRQTVNYRDERAIESALPVALAGRRILNGSGTTGMTVLAVVTTLAFASAVAGFALFGVPWLLR